MPHRPFDLIRFMPAEGAIVMPDPHPRHPVTIPSPLWHIVCVILRGVL